MKAGLRGCCAGVHVASERRCPVASVRISMHPSVRPTSFIPLALLITVATMGATQRGTTSPATAAGAASDATARIVAAAQAVLATLDEAGRAKVQFPFEGPQKTRWSNLPSGDVRARGPAAGRSRRRAQRAAVMTLLSTALSRDGYRKVTDIMRGDEVLRKDSSQPGGARPRAGGGGGVVRRGRVLPRVPRHAVGDRAMDAAVRRPSPRDQSDDGGQPGEHGAEPAGRAARDLHVRRPDGASAGQRERQGVCADQRAGRRRSAARRSSAIVSPISCSDPARTDEPFSPRAFARRRSRRRSRRCCWISCGSGPAS